MTPQQLGYTISQNTFTKYNGMFKTLQYTLNPYRVPAARHTYNTVLQAKSDIYIHSEVYYALPRWFFTKSEFKINLLVEIASLFTAAQYNSKVKGLILHVESPFKKQAINFLLEQEINDQFHQIDWLSFLQNYCDSKMFLSSEESLKKLQPLLNVSPTLEDLLINLYESSVSDLISDLFSFSNSKLFTKSTARVFLENTTKPCIFNKPYNLDFLINMVSHVPDILGIAFDEEHSFALGDKSFFIAPERNNTPALIDPRFKELETVIHYNIPPLTVESGSRKDKHSDTTLFDPGINSEFHINVLKTLNELEIPFLREVKESTMLEELKHFKNYESRTNSNQHLSERSSSSDNAEGTERLCRDRQSNQRTDSANQRQQEPTPSSERSAETFLHDFKLSFNSNMFSKFN